MRLLDTVRNGYVESWHDGSFVLLDRAGDVAVSSGPVDEPVFPRSSLKPLQAVTLLECGFAGRDGSLALASASHDGEDVHITGARATLAAAGLDESALQCPPDLPSGREALLAWVGSGGRPARICHNCSGKHAAMLATCVAARWPIDTYRSPDHPLQQAIRARIATLCSEPVRGVAIDGCGAPAFAVSLLGLARAFAVLAAAPSGVAREVADAMRTFPRLIGGTGRAVTELTAAVPGLVCKEGAEGVWAAALPDGRAFAAKIDDGGMRALPPLLAAALQHWGVNNEVVARWAAVPVLGGGAPVGAITWSADLQALLGL
ncbi:MAG TPA: asparaginase [Jatrophihabitantaceae bacterium]|jgi:L-asparaginase II|nr:asparaginase [Jatrophihabitantaceae bacterium]